MKRSEEHHDTYIIPPNFIEGGTFFGGMFKIRNVIEAGILAVAAGVPVLSIHISLTARIIILCFTAPAAGSVRPTGRFRRKSIFFYICLFQMAQKPAHCR